MSSQYILCSGGKQNMIECAWDNYKKCTRNGLMVWNCLLFLIFILPLLNCNAYFNTLYNGKTAYREAQILHNKRMNTFPDSILVTAPTEAATKYERAIEKSIKVVESFPKKKKWHDDALMLMGKSYYFKKDFQKAIRRLKEIQTDFPHSPFIPETYIYIGRCQIEEGRLDKAEETLQIALTRYPHFNDNQQITMLLVEIAIRRGGRSEAIKLLEKALKTTHSDSRRFNLVLRISQLYIDMKQYQKAIPLLLSLQRKKDFPEQSYRLDACLLVCFMETNRLSDALQLASTMASSRLYQSHNDEILYKKGIILKRMEKFDDAIDVFKIVCKGMDSTSVMYDTSSFRSKSYYELGLIYQLKKGVYKQASEYFQLASKSIDTAVNTHALRRLNAMKRLDSLRNIINSTKPDSQKYDRMIMIGELFRFDLEEPDSAYSEFIRLGNDTSASKEKIAKALCTAAIIAHDDKKDTIHADSLFRHIIDRFPQSKYAQLAQKNLKVEVTIKTRQDSALIAYKSAEEQFFKENDVKGAIRSFYEIFRQYPELDIAPKSLYAAAWYADNVLEKKITAKTLYDKICEKYKESIYCRNAAEPRIKTVRDTLAALDALRKKLESIKKNRKNNNDKKMIKRLTSDSLEVTKTTPEESDLVNNGEFAKPHDNSEIDTLNKFTSDVKKTENISQIKKDVDTVSTLPSTSIEQKPVRDSLAY